MIDDKTALEFNSYMKKFPDLYAHLAQIVHRYTSSQHPNLVDLGVGPGLLSVELFKQIPDAMVIGLDPLLTMLSIAAENAKQSKVSFFEPVLGVSEKIPLKNNSVDSIVSRFSLPYWKQPQESFMEMWRVLKPSGTVVLEELNRDFSSRKLVAIKIHMLFNQAGRDVTKYHVDAYKTAHTIEQVEEFFTNAGFLLLEKEGKKSEWRFIVVAQKK